jgi:hypothetical protein
VLPAAVLVQLEKVVSALRKAAKAAGQNGAPPAPGAAGDLHPAVNGDVAPSAAPAMLFNPAGALAPAAADPPLPGINGAPARMHTDALLPGVSDLALPSPGLLPPGQGGLLAAAAGDNSPPATPRHLAPRAAATLLPGGAAAVMTGTHGPALPAANCHMAPRTTGSSAGAPAGKVGVLCGYGVLVQSTRVLHARHTRVVTKHLVAAAPAWPLPIAALQPTMCAAVAALGGQVRQVRCSWVSCMGCMHAPVPRCLAHLRSQRSRFAAADTQCLFFVAALLLCNPGAPPPSCLSGTGQEPHHGCWQDPGEHAALLGGL